MATLDQAVEQMYAAGMPSLPGGIAKADGRLHRYGARGKGGDTVEGGGGRAYYKLYEFLARSGRRYVSGFFGMWGQIDLQKIRTDYAGIEPDEHRRLQATQADTERREREKREARTRFASVRARQQWDGARARLKDGEDCPYLDRKGLRWENGLRIAPDGTLFVPMVRYDVAEDLDADPAYQGPRRLAGLQKIGPDGEKRFNKGMDPVGAMCRFGKKPKDGDLILLGEGIATVLSCHQALERAYTTFAAFTAGNLPVAARQLRAMFPKSPVLVLADDDAYLWGRLVDWLRVDYGVAQFPPALDMIERELEGKGGKLYVRADLHEDAHRVPLLTAGVRQGEGAAVTLRTRIFTNAGLTKAWEASTAIGNAWVAHPVFVARPIPLDPQAAKLTDWNDLQACEGAPAVVTQLAAHVKAIEEAHALAAALKGGGGAPAAAGADGGKGGDGGVDRDWQLHGWLLRRFTQVYPSDTAYDAEKGRVVRIEHMRLRFGNPAVGMWLASPRKRVIDPEQLVFDPSGTSDPATTVNLFRGLPPQAPEGGSCELLLQLVHYLCGENHEDTEMPPRTRWLLRWLAYPLQHVGAKMQTAVIVHGEEGTGKNLLFGAVRRMYGRHGGVITQRQLEDKFNTWQSAKLFVVANEVVTRQEMSHQAGYIRNLITEPEFQINPKFQDERAEANHMNIVFLANALQPVLLGLNDRRCFVVRTPNPLAEEFYKRVGAELAEGGVAAFYRYLRDLDLGDFNEHTKPPMTEAKRALIELGMSTPQLFWQELKDGLLGLPYAPALATDLYKAYCVWCARNGYKMPEGMKFFSPNFMSMNGVRRVDRFVPDPGNPVELAVVGTEAEEKSLRKRRVFLMGNPEPDEAAEKLRVVHGVALFRTRLREYLREELGGDAGPARQGQGLRQQDVF